MKKMIITTALLLTAAGLGAQGKKPAKPAAPVAAAPVAAAAEAPKAAAKSSWLQLGVWGGYNIASSDAFTTIETSVDTLNANFTSKKTSTVTKGGIAGGADFWLGSDFQYGLGLAYLQTYKLAWSNSENAVKASIDASIAYIPVQLQVQYTIAGFKVGAGAGLALGIGETKATVTGSGSSDIATTEKVKGSAFLVSAMLSYGLNFGNISTDLGVRYYAIFDTKLVNNIVPNLTIGFKF